MTKHTTHSPELPENFEDINALRRDASREASNIREVFWRKSFPVDPVKIALALGAEVYEAQLGSDIFGALLQDSDLSMRIYIDKDQPASRYRFSAAHELGHYVDRSRRLEVLSRDIDRRSNKSQTLTLMRVNAKFGLTNSQRNYSCLKRKYDSSVRTGTPHPYA